MKERILKSTAFMIMYGYLSIASFLLLMNDFNVSESDEAFNNKLAQITAITADVPHYREHAGYAKKELIMVTKPGEQESAVPDDDVLQGTVYEVPENNGFKSFMPYTAIKSGNQKQLQENAITADCGIRMVEDRYCVAIGTHFNAEIGQYFDLVLENGAVIPCILADVKADIHTDKENIFTVVNGCCSEFVVDVKALPLSVRRQGSLSYLYEEWNSPVVQVITYEKYL